MPAAALVPLVPLVPLARRSAGAIVATAFIASVRLSVLVLPAASVTRSVTGTWVALAAGSWSAPTQSCHWLLSTSAGTPAMLPIDTITVEPSLAVPLSTKPASCSARLITSSPVTASSPSTGAAVSTCSVRLAGLAMLPARSRRSVLSARSPSARVCSSVAVSLTDHRPLATSVVLLSAPSVRLSSWPSSAPLALPVMVSAWRCSTALSLSSPATGSTTTTGALRSSCSIRLAVVVLPAASVTSSCSGRSPSPSFASSAAAKLALQRPPLASTRWLRLPRPKVTVWPSSALVLPDSVRPAPASLALMRLSPATTSAVSVGGSVSTVSLALAVIATLPAWSLTSAVIVSKPCAQVLSSAGCSVTAQALPLTLALCVWPPSPSVTVWPSSALVVPATVNALPASVAFSTLSLAMPLVMASVGATRATA